MDGWGEGGVEGEEVEGGAGGVGCWEGVWGFDQGACLGCVDLGEEGWGGEERVSSLLWDRNCIVCVSVSILDGRLGVLCSAWGALDKACFVYYVYYGYA